MTLVLTELNQHGISMAADSAVTFRVPLPDGGFKNRVLHGADKLQPVHHINAGISCWGLSSINGVDTDIWITDLIQRSRSTTSDLHSFASFLASELNSALPPNSQNSGFHVAGFVQIGTTSLPAFYHVHNGISQYFTNINTSIFNANFDRSPQQYQPGQFYITRNGDYQFYAQFFTYFQSFLQSLPLQPQLAGISIPSPDDLYTRARLLRLQIQTIAGLYDVSNLVPGIGGPITLLGIGPRGHEFYETSP
ncbi:MAG: hypothetical protein ABIE07_11740 [Candidatus Zixiibacteriota bacterium]